MSQLIRTSKGFSLMEMVIVIALLGFLGALVAQIMSGNFTAYFTASTIGGLASKTNIAADNLMRELKSARSVSAVSSTGMTFVNQAGDTIVISKTGANMRRSVNGGTARTLCNHVTSLTLAYYTQALASTSTPANVNYVTLSMTTTDNDIPYKLIAGTILREISP